MKTRRIATLVAAGLAFGGLVGCAGGTGPAAGAAAADAQQPMTQARMEMLFADQVDAIVGPPGAIQTQIDGINVYLISMPVNDRMRIIAPFARVENVSRQVLDVLMVANFHSTLDARYAISEGILYSVFLHPISSLSPELLRSGLSQVVSLVKTFGTTYSSGALVFGTTPEDVR